MDQCGPRKSRSSIGTFFGGLLVVACGASDLEPQPTDARAAPVVEARAIALWTNDLVLDRSRRVIYASVPSRQGPTGNSVATIDPEAGTVTSTIFVGSEPGALALSDDASTLYVALDGSASFRGIDLATGSLAPPVSFEKLDERGIIIVEAMDVAPGAPHTVVLTRGGGLVVYDGDVPRPAVWKSESGDPLFGFAAGATGHVYGGSSSWPELAEVRLAASGLETVRTVSLSEVPQLDASTLLYDRGQLFFRSGHVMDVATLGIEARFPARGPVSLSADGSVVHFLSTERPYGPEIVSCDRGSHGVRSVLRIPAPITVEDLPDDLVEWSTDAFAFRTPDRVHLARHTR